MKTIVKLFFFLMVSIVIGNTYSLKEQTQQYEQDISYYYAMNEMVIEKPIMGEPIKEVITESNDKIEKPIPNPNEQIQEKIEKVPESTKEPIKEPIQEPTQEVILETIIGSLSGYGPDCYGCTSNKTASGYDISNGIYYQDTTYGSIRIVSGDSKYPFGTIVRITSSTFSEPIIAIVLDRGGSAGIDKKIQFDLLFTSEKEASQIGTLRNVTFEILRLGTGI